VRVFVAHLISDTEADFIRDRGLNDFYDLLGEHDYPLVFDPQGESMVP
jgi:hypothetical protein